MYQSPPALVIPEDWSNAGFDGSSLFEANTVDKCRYSEEAPARSNSNLEKGKNVELEWQSVAPESDMEDMTDSNPVTGNEFIPFMNYDGLDTILGSNLQFEPIFTMDSSIQAPQLPPESPIFRHPGPGEQSGTLPDVFYGGAL
ncbi:hypothetical protein FRC09_003300 [Ceratobasidium sp. 395]|nr:hypothetical protein FRC09_003300 [Ceratobasidium sp. 395]